MRRLKGDNKGLSLIEVLIAVIIVAIVAVPFLRSFITAAHANNRAKRAHKATTLAQSLVEGLKTETLEDICMQFNYPGVDFRLLDTARINLDPDDASDNIGNHILELYYTAGTGYVKSTNYEDPSLTGLTEEQKRNGVTSSTFSTDSGNTHEFWGQTNGYYDFALTDVQVDDSAYDVLVQLDARTYINPGAVDVNHLYNKEEFTQVPVIDLNKDALYVHKQDYTDDAISEFRPYTLMPEWMIKSLINRTITMTVEQTDMGGGVYRTRVLADYIYSIYLAGTQHTYTRTYTCYDSAETGEELRSVYLYYYPLYSIGTYRDTIIFDNPSKVPVDFYLLKQKDESEAQLGYWDENYIVNVQFTEPGATKDTMHAKLFTNLGTNLATGAPLTSISNCRMSVQGIPVQLDELTASSSEILSTASGHRVFDITVSVYEEGAMEADFPQSMRLISLSGSRLN